MHATCMVPGCEFRSTIARCITSKRSTAPTPCSPTSARCAGTTADASTARWTLKLDSLRTITVLLPDGADGGRNSPSTTGSTGT
ncbi:MAG: hypothetical protein R2705_16930 [Ilumatobacteraceae bacterium]